MTALVPDAIDIALQSQRDQHAKVAQLAAEANKRIDELDKSAPREIREKRIRQIRSEAENAGINHQYAMRTRSKDALAQLCSGRVTKGTETERALREIDALGRQADLILTETTTGKANPVERLKVAHLVFNPTVVIMTTVDSTILNVR